MCIEINGQARDLPSGMTVLALLDFLEMNVVGTVVERNGEIVDRGAFASVTLCEGDRLELVRLVGGG